VEDQTDSPQFIDQAHDESKRAPIRHVLRNNKVAPLRYRANKEGQHWRRAREAFEGWAMDRRAARGIEDSSGVPQIQDLGIVALNHWCGRTELSCMGCPRV
jgi:hypothetical protein